MLAATTSAYCSNFALLGKPGPPSSPDGTATTSMSTSPMCFPSFSRPPAGALVEGGSTAPVRAPPELLLDMQGGRQQGPTRLSRPPQVAPPLPHRLTDAPSLHRPALTAPWPLGQDTDAGPIWDGIDDADAAARALTEVLNPARAALGRAG